MTAVYVNGGLPAHNQFGRSADEFLHSGNAALPVLVVAPAVHLPAYAQGQGVLMAAGHSPKDDGGSDGLGEGVPDGEGLGKLVVLVEAKHHELARLEGGFLGDFGEVQFDELVVSCDQPSLEVIGLQGCFEDGVEVLLVIALVHEDVVAREDKGVFVVEKEGEDFLGVSMVCCLVSEDREPVEDEGKERVPESAACSGVAEEALEEEVELAVVLERIVLFK